MKIYLFLGTTAELIKMAPVIKELKRKKIPFRLVTSGQTEILFNEFTNYLGITRPDISFITKKRKSSVFHFALWAAKTFFVAALSLGREFTNRNKKRTHFIVHGDTVSSLLGALIAKLYGLKLVHVESGLRSFNFLEPFPEEICRCLISQLADINFCPNSWCVANLQSVRGVKVNTFQNTLIDILNFAVDGTKQIDSLNHLPKKYFVLVLHRQEHVMFSRQKTREIFQAILGNEKRFPCVLIMHKLTSDFLKSTGVETKVLKNQRIIPVPRLPHRQFMRLLSQAQYIITDGGSNQEEAYYLGKPCLLLRKHTERIEGLGENVVLSQMNKRIIKQFQENYQEYGGKRIQATKSPAKIIVDYLVKQKL